MDDIKCQECGADVEYLFKHGEKYLPVCEMCGKDWAFETACDNNEFISCEDIADMDDDDIVEIKKSIVIG